MSCIFCSRVHPDHQPSKRCQECIDANREMYIKTIKKLSEKHGVSLSDIDVNNLILEVIREGNDGHKI